ncbi:MAG: hypothetical protein PHS32_16145 [Rhodoferax sp.]|uniref:hypothetical protein n=1 Tax=Rhodoferax sp. TaxID=50421 RepID=UPI002616F8BF|nr:hypothetical protein [Rhodoferax sp.]MDD5335263.1 hypothetical protein [Rhodoferax sp.]
MDLSEFIAATLSEIQKGVESAIKSTIATGVTGVINPVWGTHEDVGSGQLQNVHFDVAVTVVEKVTGQVDGGIKVVGVRLGASGSGTTESTEVSRVEFTIPIVPPVTTVSKK